MKPFHPTALPPPRRSHDAGFSLVELMVASVLLVLALTGTSVLFVESNRSSAAAETRYRQQALVDTDLARVRRLNDRYTCSTGICTSLGSVELGKNDFFPPPASSAANGNSSGELLRRVTLVPTTVAWCP